MYSFLLLVGSFAAFGSLHASEFNPQCPPKLSSSVEQTLKQLPADWRVFQDKVNTTYNLEGVNFYAGPPEELAMLMPEDNGSWSFGRPGPHIWQVCVYAETSIQLARKIPDSIKNCRAIYEPTSGAHAVHTGSGNPVINSIVCK